MKHVIYEYQIPDPTRRLEAERSSSAPPGELIDFVPTPVASADVVGRQIDEVSTNIGTYGMGGIGFFGLRLGSEWLIIAIGAAGAWIHADGRLVEDYFYIDCGRPKPWIVDDADELSEALVGHHIGSIDVRRHSLRLAIDGAPTLVIEESADTRPKGAWKNESRAFGPEDDLRRAVFLAPTCEIWV